MWPNQVILILLLILITFLADLIQYVASHNLKTYTGQTARITYTQDFLLNTGLLSTRPCFKDTSLLPPECVRGNNAKARKRGRKGGIRKRIKRQPYRQCLPSTMFGNVQSLRNKVDGPAISIFRTTGNCASSASQKVGLRRRILTLQLTWRASRWWGWTATKTPEKARVEVCVYILIISIVTLLTLQWSTE